MPVEPESTAKPDRRDQVGSLGRGLAAVEILAARPDGMTLTEMATEAGLTRAGARRILLTLVEAGWADLDKRVFRLSPLLLTLTRTWLDRQSLWTFALGPMRALSEELRESCSAGVLSGTDIVYVARVPGERITSVSCMSAPDCPPHGHPWGACCLPGCPRASGPCCSAAWPLVALTPKTIVDRQALATEISKVGRDGHAIVDEELEMGLRSIAVPLRDRHGRTVAAINVSAPSARASVDDLRRAVLPTLRRAADRIEGWFALD